MSRTVIELKNIIDRCTDEIRIPDIWWRDICEQIVSAVDPQDDREDDICSDLICASGIGFNLIPVWEDDEILKLSHLYDSPTTIGVTEPDTANSAKSQ